MSSTKKCPVSSSIPTESQPLVDLKSPIGVVDPSISASSLYGASDSKTRITQSLIPFSRQELANRRFLCPSTETQLLDERPAGEMVSSSPLPSFAEAYSRI